LYGVVSWMQQLLAHWLLVLQSAWHALSFETQTAPPGGTPVPDWQHWDVDVHEPPGAEHVVPPLPLPLPPPLPLPASEAGPPLLLPEPPPELLEEVMLPH
jgi:hypothetical protein